MRFCNYYNKLIIDYFCERKDEPYYPVNDERNSALYQEYKKLAEAEGQEGPASSDGKQAVIFGGRLGEYKYYDMDQVIRAALDCVDREIGRRY